MRDPRRLLALAAVLYVTVGVGVARAQTVIAKNAPPGSTIELVQNEAKTGSVTASSDGTATLAGNLPETATDKEAQIYVDVCPTVRRVLLVERGQQPPTQGEGCARRQVTGFFLVRRVTTLVVDVASQPPAAWLRQGPVPKAWLGQDESSPGKAWRALPKGFVPFAGGGIAKSSGVVTQACGSVASCSNNDLRAAFIGGASYWFARYAAVEGSFLRPANLNMHGSDTTYNFTTTWDAYVLTLGGQGGVPLGPVRAYGKGGANYHRATSTTSETIQDITITVDGVAQTIPGGTQTFLTKTSGWGWQFGGGIEGWLTRRFAIYGEAMYLKIKGSAIDGGPATIDERMTVAIAGVRIHVGR